MGEMIGNKVIKNCDRCYKDDKGKCRSKSGGWGGFRMGILEGFMEMMTFKL